MSILSKNLASLNNPNLLDQLRKVQNNKFQKIDNGGGD